MQSLKTDGMDKMVKKLAIFNMNNSKTPLCTRLKSENLRLSRPSFRTFGSKGSFIDQETSR